MIIKVDMSITSYCRIFLQNRAMLKSPILLNTHYEVQGHRFISMSMGTRA